MLSRAYDMVLNGNEIGGGSVRIHRTEMQRAVFGLLGISEGGGAGEVRLPARSAALRLPAARRHRLRHRSPRHADGRRASIRDVIAFPKTQTAHDPLTDAPSVVPDAQLRELGIRVRTPTADGSADRGHARPALQTSGIGARRRVHHGWLDAPPRTAFAGRLLAIRDRQPGGGRKRARSGRARALRRDRARRPRAAGPRSSGTFPIAAPWRARYAPDVTLNVEHYFALRLEREAAISIAAHEHLRYEWLSFADAIARVSSPSNRELIERIAHEAAA